MSRKRPDSAASSHGLTTRLGAYALDMTVGMVIEKVGSMLSSPQEPLSEFERRKLILARSALRTARTRFAALLSPPTGKPIGDQGEC